MTDIKIVIIITNPSARAEYDKRSKHNNSLPVDDNTYAPPLWLSTLAKEFTAATRIMQSSWNEFSTLESSEL